MIAIGILSFNHPQLTKKCIESILAFHSQEELYLLHNGSEIENIEFLKWQFPQIHHVVFEKNRGFSGGANGLCEAVFQNSDWLFFVSNDCRLMSKVTAPECLPGLFAPKIFRRGMQRVDSVMGGIDFSRGHLTHFRSENDFSKANKNSQIYVPGTAFFMHKEVYTKVGKFDESLGTYWEDVDFSLRAQAMGFPISHRPETQLEHGIGKTCYKDKYYTTYLFQRNRRIVSLRHCPESLKFRLKLRFLHQNISAKIMFFNNKDGRRELLLRAIHDAEFSTRI